MELNTHKKITMRSQIKHGGLYGIDNQNIIDFSSSVNPIGYPQVVVSIIKKIFYYLPIYPDPDSKQLCKNLSKHINTKMNQIIIGNGSIEIIYNFCQAFLQKKISVLIPIPTFGEYEAAARLNDCKITFFKTMNLNHDIEIFLKKIPKNGCVFICNPNNPTGILIKKKSMLRIIKIAQMRSTIIFIDECFMELVYISDESVIKHVKHFDNLFLLRSLTKSFGLAGLRIGYGVSNNKLIEILKKIKIPWSVNIIAQKVALSLLYNKSHLEKSKKLIKNEMAYLINSISKLDDFICYDSSTNFILIKANLNVDILQKKLITKKILIRNCSNFRGLNSSFFRVSIRTHKENLKLVKALESVSRKH